MVRLVGHTVGGGTWLWVTLEVEDERVAMGFGLWLEVEYEFFHGVPEEF